MNSTNPFSQMPIAFESEIASLQLKPGWSLIGDRNNMPYAMDTVDVSLSSRTAHKIVGTFSAIRLTFTNNYSGPIYSPNFSEFPGSNPVLVRAFVEVQGQPEGASGIPATFGGANVGWMGSGEDLVSDPVYLSINGSSVAPATVYIRSGATALTTAPATLSASLSTVGGSLVVPGGAGTNGAFAFSATYVLANGKETAGSIPLTVGATGNSATTTGSVLITSPAAAAGAIGYRVYSNYPQFGGQVLTGTTTNSNNVITGVPSTAGLVVGSGIFGSNIPTGTTISSFTSTTITLSANASGSGAGVFVVGVPFTGTKHTTTTIDGIASTAAIKTGMTVIGAGIPANTTVSTVSANSITISNAATDSATSVLILAGTGIFPSYFSVSMAISGTIPIGTNYTVQNVPLIPFGRVPNSPLVVGPETAGPVVNNPYSPFGAYTGIPVGMCSLGGTALGALNNGEWTVYGSDTADPYLPQAAPSNPTNYVFSPLYIEGYSATTTYPSCLIIGDSLSQGIGDDAYDINGNDRINSSSVPIGANPYASDGGYVSRAFANQLGLSKDNVSIPVMGFLNTSIASDANYYFAFPHGGEKRKRWATKATNVIGCQASNDILIGLSTAEVVRLTVAQSLEFTNRGQNFWRMTVSNGESITTDGFQTLVNQTFNPAHGIRLAANNVFRSTSPARVITAEPLFRVLAAGHNNASRVFGMFGIGDGATINYMMAFPFRNDGFLVVYVNGVPIVQGSGAGKYTLTDAGSLLQDGFTYYSGITFGTAPVTGSVVTATYTACPGFSVLNGSPYLKGCLDPHSAYNVDLAGNQSTTYGLIRVPPAANTVVGTVSSSTAVSGSTPPTITFSAATGGFPWAVNQWRGYTCYINNGANAGAWGPIVSNTTTTLTISFKATNAGVGGFYGAAAPVSGVTCNIYAGNMVDIAHASSFGHQALAQVLKPLISNFQ